MDRKKILILAFALMVVAQFYVPISMIGRVKTYCQKAPRISLEQHL
jgi:hypothetical protein